jgi:hypothetical protein
MIKLDLDRYFDTATVDEYILTESTSTPMTWLKKFWARYLVDEAGNPVPEEQAFEMLGKLTLRNFRDLRVEGELRDLAIPPASSSG